MIQKVVENLNFPALVVRRVVGSDIEDLSERTKNPEKAENHLREKITHDSKSGRNCRFLRSSKTPPQGLQSYPYHHLFTPQHLMLPIHLTSQNSSPATRKLHFHPHCCASETAALKLIIGYPIPPSGATSRMLIMDIYDM